MFKQIAWVCVVVSLFAGIRVGYAAEPSEDLSNPNQTYSLKMAPAAPAPPATAPGRPDAARVAGGPTEFFLYASKGDRNSPQPEVNTYGKFLLGAAGVDGEAVYWWRGQGPASNPEQPHREKLVYVGRAVLSNNRPDARPDVTGWLYRGEDSSGSQWWLFFGEDPLVGFENLPVPHYPIYYSFDSPDKNRFMRWLTRSGTKRL